MHAHVACDVAQHNYESLQASAAVANNHIMPVFI